MGPKDDVFRTLALRTRYLTEDQLATLAGLQKEQSSEAASLFELAKKTGLLDPQRAKDLETLASAEQAPPPAPPPEKKEVATKSSPRAPITKRRAFAAQPTPSRGRREVGRIPKGSSNAVVVIAGLVAVLLIAAGAIYVSQNGDKKDEVATAPTPPPPAPVVSPPVEQHELPPPPVQKDPPVQTDPPKAQRVDLRAARIRLSSELSDVEQLMKSDRLDDALALLDKVRSHTPKELIPELDDAVRRLNERLASSSSGPKEPRRDQPRNDDTPPERPRPDFRPDTRPEKPDPGAALERARFALARAQVTRYLAELDTETAHKALEGDATPYATQSIKDSFGIDKKRIEAVEKLAGFASAGFKTSIGESLDLALRNGTKVTGKLVKVENGKLQLQIGDAKATVATPLGKLAVDAVFSRALSQAKAAPEWYFFGRAVVLAATGDKQHALEALAIAGPAIAEAASFKRQLEENDPTLEPAPADGPSTTGGPKDPNGGTIVINPNDPDNPFGEKKSKRPRTWMDDTDGGVEWSQAYEFETAHYHIKTNVKKEYAKRWGKILEALASRYIDIFQFSDNDFKYKKNEFDLYKSQREFMAHENQSSYVGGFYEPWSKRLVTFQGPWEGADDATTLSIVAHEATHQFQNLVLREMNHAPTFIIEGLATFFEGTVIRDEEVIIGRISSMRLKDLQRAIKDNSYVHLNELIHTSHMNYSGFHYAHGWGLIHWCMFGPENKKAIKLVQAYWNLCCKQPTTGDDFEQMVKSLGPGWNLDKLETAWKDWVMSLDIHNDPAVKAYEKKTGKKFPVEDYEPSEKEKKDEAKEKK